MINPECLLRGLADAKENRHRFNMGYWGRSNNIPFISHEGILAIAHKDCNSVLCIAGWASQHVPLDPNKVLNNTELHYVDKAVLHHCCHSNIKSSTGEGDSLAILAEWDLSELFCGRYPWFPDDINIEDITIEQAEAAVHRWIVIYGGQECLDQALANIK